MKNSYTLLKIAVLIGVLGLFYWGSKKVNVEKVHRTFKTEITKDIEELKETVRKIPEFKDPKTKTFKWKYKNVPYEVNITVYKSAYDFYKSSPKYYTYRGELPEDWEEEYYKMLIDGAENDEIITKLASAIALEGRKKNLTKDQIVELTLSFVQSIPYDEEKAKSIEEEKGEIYPRYPYEVLYEEEAVCSGKSFLAAALMKELGYGTVLFEYKENKHIAIGIQCPKEHSDYSSGYCYAETTKEGHKIGTVPELEISSNAAVTRQELSHFNEQQTNQTATRKLGTPKLYQKVNGKTYYSIIETIKTEKEIAALENEIYNTKPELEELKDEAEDKEDEFKKLEKKLKKLKKEGEKSGDYDEYNKLVPKYNDAVEDYKDKVEEYNDAVETYNKKINKYNSLVKQFNS